MVLPSLVKSGIERWSKHEVKRRIFEPRTVKNTETSKMTDEIRTQRDAKFASDHELATQYREAKKIGDTLRRNLVVEEALDRGIATEKLREIQ